MVLKVVVGGTCFNESTKTKMLELQTPCSTNLLLTLQGGGEGGGRVATLKSGRLELSLPDTFVALSSKQSDISHLFTEKWGGGGNFSELILIQMIGN